MNEDLQTKLDDAALLLMMQHPDDKDGYNLILEALAPLQEPLRETKLLELDHDLALILGKTNASGDSFLTELKDWVARAQVAVTSADSADNTQMTGSWAAKWGADIGGNFDADLIREFIDTHPQKLEEFELDLLESAQGRSAEPEGVDARAKAYLHNLKGDAGTVGMHGIEKVAHRVEDEFLRRSALSMMEPLRAFVAWAIQTINWVAAKQEPRETSSQFVERFIASIGAEVEPISSDQISIEILGENCQKAQTGSSAAETHASIEYVLTGEADIFIEFKAEAEDHLERVEGILLAQDDGFNIDDINAIFRAVHSIKGGSSYFSLQEMTRTSHTLENLLDKSRKGQLQIDQPFKNLILEYIDLQKELFAAGSKAIDTDRKMSTGTRAAELLVRLRGVLERAETGESGVAPHTLPDAHPIADICAVESGVVAQTPASVTAESVAAADNEVSTQSLAVDKQELSDSKQSALRKDERIDTKAFVKVETTRLDRLIEYIGEMVISSSMLSKSCRDLLSHNEGVVNNTRQLEQISREIQSIGMSMRLVPIKGLLQKMSRLVWDTSKKIGKEANFETEGEETELDRTVIDKLADPLMHMIRNSVDHGIETPEARVAAGKPRAGTVKVSASHFGGSIHVKITDDGKGLNPESLLKKAIEKGLASSSDNFTNQEIFHFIFAAGFSTAEKVTDISGRGVGMDVVRRNIEAMRGRVHIDSKLGKGTVFTIELPLTLAIVDGIETKVGEERFIIPTHSVIEFVKPKAHMLSSTLNQVETFEFRGKYLPVFRLSELNATTPRYTNATDAILAVIESNNEYLALMIDEVVGGYSTVIKPLGPTFRNVKGLSGAAIMPDGNIGLIVDTATLFSLAKVEGRLVDHRKSENASQAVTVAVH